MEFASLLPSGHSDRIHILGLGGRCLYLLSISSAFKAHLYGMYDTELSRKEMMLLTVPYKVA